MSTTVETSNDILDMLFSSQDGILCKEMNDTTNMSLDCDDTYPEDLLSSLLSGDVILPEDADILTSNYPTDDFKIQNAASPQQSDSGLSSEGPISPNGSDQLLSDNSYSPLNDQELFGMNDISMSDLSFQTLDTSCLLNDDLASQFELEETNYEDVSIDMGLTTESHNLSTENSVITSTATTVETTTTTTPQIIRIAYTKSSQLPFTVKDVNPPVQLPNPNVKFPELMLTDEEKYLLEREGVALPTDMPLTKEEERVLKAVRRKIRNKISAKESRKKKQSYVENLENRVKLSTAQNSQLNKKVKVLEQQNMSLMVKLKKLQQILSKCTGKPAQASTCIMVLAMSFALLVFPNFNPFYGDDGVQNIMKTTPMAGRSRSLLVQDPVYSDVEEPYSVTIKPGPPWESPPKTPAVPLSKLPDALSDDNSTETELADGVEMAPSSDQDNMADKMAPEASRYINDNKIESPDPSLSKIDLSNEVGDLSMNSNLKDSTLTQEIVQDTLTQDVVQDT